MPIISKPFSEYILYASFKNGISSLQGPHQLAQKSKRTYFIFRKEDKEIVSLLMSSAVKSGAKRPLVIPQLPPRRVRPA